MFTDIQKKTNRTVSLLLGPKICLRTGINQHMKNGNNFSVDILVLLLLAYPAYSFKHKVIEAK